jgi:hypothetical protein
MDTLEKYIETITETEEDILKRKRDKPQQVTKNGFDVLFKLYSNNKEQLLQPSQSSQPSQLKGYLSQNRIAKEGNMVDGLSAIKDHLQNDVKEFISYFIYKNIIYRHQMVSLRKMGNGTQATNKFIIEEQMIRLIDTFPPRWTSPRMNALQNLLFDLQVINDEGNITELHTKMLANNGYQT